MQCYEQTIIDAYGTIQNFNKIDNLEYKQLIKNGKY